jgi:hypothetical protein
MKRLLLLAIVASAAVLGQGCLVAPVIPPYGIIFSDLKAPLDIDMNNTPVSSKSGRAMTTSIIGLVATGDASINTAARDGGLTTIHYADYEYKNLVGIIQNYTTVVYGD